MPRKFLSSLSLHALIVLSGTFVFAQNTPTTSATAVSQQEQLRKEAEDREKNSAALRSVDSSRNLPGRTLPDAGSELNTRFFEFQRAIPKFREATNEYRWTLSMDGKLDKHLKSLTEQTDVMLRYLSAAKSKHPNPDPAEFKGYTIAELRWETLNTAERIATFVNFAVLLERPDVVSAKTLEFLYALDGELRRLKWLATHTK